MSRSKVIVECLAVDLRGSACQVQQKAITVKFEVKGGHYRGACVDNRVDVVDRLLFTLSL